MRVLLVGLGLLLGCKAQEALPTPPATLNLAETAFVSQCRYGNGIRILLAHRFGTDSYQFIISRGAQNELATIRVGENGALEIETNGGVGKIVAVERLVGWLLGQPFRAVSESAFANEFERGDVLTCPGEYPFSPS